VDRPAHPAGSTPAAADRGPSKPAGKAAAALLTALARAARAFVLYKPSNATVRQLLAEYQAKAEAALAQHGELLVAIRPFEMALGGEVVYRDTDREKSLAFKLFRDGVRRLHFRPGTSWEELLELLEILAVRCTGVRQSEDDLLTLLRKAEFRGITVEAVEGFTPAEEEPEMELDETVERARRVQPPAGWDTPVRKFPPPGPLEYRPLPTAALEALRSLADKDVSELALELARDLLAEAMRAGWPSPNPDLIAFFAELRDGLLASGQLGPLRRLVEVLAEAGKGEMRGELLQGLGDARTLDIVLASVPEDAAELPPDLVPVLPLLGIEAALERLATEAAEGRRRLLVQIVLARLPGEAPAVLARLPSLEPLLARKLAREVVARAPERATEVGRQLLAQQDENLRLEGLALLEGAQSGVPIRPLCALLNDRSEPVRTRTAELLGRRGGVPVVTDLRIALEQDRERSPREVEAIGRAIARADPTGAAPILLEWMTAKGGLLRGLNARQRALQWAGVAGMELLPGPMPEQALRALADRSKGDVRRQCLLALTRRRKEAPDGK